MKATIRYTELARGVKIRLRVSLRNPAVCPFSSAKTTSCNSFTRYLNDKVIKLPTVENSAPRERANSDRKIRPLHPNNSAALGKCSLFRERRERAREHASSQSDSSNLNCSSAEGRLEQRAKVDPETYVTDPILPPYRRVNNIALADSIKQLYYYLLAALVALRNAPRDSIIYLTSFALVPTSLMRLVSF